MAVNVQKEIALTQLVIDFIRSLGWDDTEESGYPLQPGSYILEAPDRIVHITATGGPGYVTEEGSAEAISFQLRLRGPVEDPIEPDQMISMLDRAILAATTSFPLTIDGIKIQSISRAGSPPTPLPVDPADLRHEFTCNYVMIKQGA